MSNLSPSPPAADHEPVESSDRYPGDSVLYTAPRVSAAGDDRIGALEAKIHDLERRLVELSNDLDRRAGYEGINEAMITLGQKSLKNNHNYNYLGSRFQDYELSLLNVKQMGYYIGLMEMSKLGDTSANLITAPPLSTKLMSKLCTQSDCQTDWFMYWLKEMRCGFTYHRKLWEFAYIAQNIYAHGAMAPNKRGLGFGCGEEPLASLFAKHGASALATDLAPEDSEAQGQGWIEAGQHGGTLDRVRNASVCPDPKLLANVTHQHVDMNHIPPHLFGEFDFCWSACALEHIGSIKLGLAFIENSMDTLQPGGIAVHTTEYNLDERGETIDNSPTVLFQRRHMEALKLRLEAKGYEILGYDFSGGGGVLDGLFDIPPWPWDVAKLSWQMQECVTHLKRSIGGFPCTSMGITIIKPG